MRQSKSTWIETLWHDRLIGELVAVRDGLSSVELTYKVKFEREPRLNLDSLHKADLDVQQAADVVLLYASMVRRDKNPKSSQVIVDLVHNWLQEQHSPLVFQYHLQSGLNSLAQGARSKAMHDFVAAKALAVKPLEQLFSGINLVLCLEDLGFDYDNELDSVKKLLSTCAHESWVYSILAEYEALCLRKSFRAADIEYLRQLCDAGFTGDQAKYYIAFITNLPFFGVQEDLRSVAKKAVASLVERINEGYLVPFELRTIRGLAVDDDDSVEVRSTERIERIYLWTWRWLLVPHTHDLNRILQTKDILFKRAIGVLTRDDFLKLENALRWLALFAGVDSASISLITHSLQFTSQREVPLLDYESLLLDWLFARRDGDLKTADHIAKRLERHCLAENKDFSLNTLVKSLLESLENAPSPWDNLYPALREVVTPQGGVKSGISIDVMSGQVKCFKDNILTHDVRSPAMAQLLSFATRIATVPAAEVMHRVFGIPRFDVAQHEQKLGKLLVQVNKLAKPWLRFSRRSALIYIDGDRSKAQMASTTPHTECWGLQGDGAGSLLRTSLTLGTSPAKKAKATEDHKTRGDGLMTRQDIQELLNCSKSAATERIHEWVEAGQIARIGEGKASRYKPTAKYSWEQLLRKKNRSV